MAADTGPTTAAGVLDVPQPRAEVWRALAVLVPYCAVCDVSYVLGGEGGEGRAALGIGTRFVCSPGRPDGQPPRPGAPQGEILAWEPPELVVTRLVLTPETWTTRIELSESGGGTRVAMTITHEPTGGRRLVRRLRRGLLRGLVQRTVDAELAKVPGHIAQVTGPA
ncbi:MAG: Polyketide cyclase / dehydrase and lipid transport [Blastococcus sp.]|nr:Polyketide cyclase / dehydrase and lipid transport [Blastococcus sp.]